MVDAGEKNRVSFLTTAQFQRLEVACRPVYEAFGNIPYLVGSHSERPDFHDVDVRLILHDGDFDDLFGRRPHLWSFVCHLVSEHLSRETSLPIDFQVQRMTEANDQYPDGMRNPMGYGHRLFAGGGDATRWLPEESGEETVDA